MELGLSGLASGFDWRALIDQLSDVERAPQRRLRSEQSTLDLRKNAYSGIATQLGILQNRVNTLKDPLFFDSRLAQSSDTAFATATAANGALQGAYLFNVTQLATASTQTGSANVGLALNPSNDVSNLLLNQASLSLAPTDGTFTVNGKQIAIATSDSLQAVFDKINAATGGAVTGSYNSATDTVSLAAASPIVLGTTTDTSNFLEAFKLHNNGTDTISSASALGAVRVSSPLAQSNLATPVSDGGGAAGEFRINGVSIAFDASQDAIGDILARINAAGAGVFASYDASQDKFILTNSSTGDIGMALEDVTGNFLAATGLAGGTLNRGQNLLYSVNGGGQLSSYSNTITASSSAIAGLSVSVKQSGAFNVHVASDTDKIKTAINDFIAEYNKSQSMIDAETASTTDAEGVVAAGDLAVDPEANALASRLRALVTSAVSGVSGVIARLDHLGIVSNGTDDTMTLSDSETLDDALANRLEQIRDLFTNESDGLAVQFANYLEATIGDEGSIPAKQDNLSRQIAGIDTQIVDLERLVLANEERLIASFVAMEEAQARINQQLQFLLQRFGSQ